MTKPLKKPYRPDCKIDWKNPVNLGVWRVACDSDDEVYAALEYWHNKNYVVYQLSTVPVAADEVPAEALIGWGLGTWQDICFLYRSDAEEVFRTREEAAAVSDVPAGAEYVNVEYYWGLQDDGSWTECCSGFYRTFSSVESLVAAWKEKPFRPGSELEIPPPTPHECETADALL